MSVAALSFDKLWSFLILSDCMAFKFSDDQLNKLSDICSDIALMALASVALPAIFDKSDAILVVAGLISTLFFWLLSLHPPFIKI